MAPTHADIRPITPGDATAYSALRLAMLADAPLALGRSPDVGRHGGERRDWIHAAPAPPGMRRDAASKG